MKIWKQYNPVRVISGAGSLKKLPDLLPQSLGNPSYILVTTKGMVCRGTAQRIMDLMPQAYWSTYTALPNPDLDDLDAEIEQLSTGVSAPFSAIVALGGGSVMDSAKALACGLAQNAPSRPLAQWLRKGEDVHVTPLPLFCLPTTSGTGSEVTPFATIWDHAQQKKRSLAGEYSFAHTALLDPDLTLSLPWNETLYGALDALSHALETLWNKNATPCSALFSVEACKAIITNLHKVERNPQDCEARSHLQNAACFAGMAIAQNKTSLAHAMSYPLTLHFGVPHGLACAAYLQPMMHFVTAKNGWHPLFDYETKASVQAFLDYYKPSLLLSKFASPHEVIKYIDEMFTPERADTFSVRATADDVHSFIFYEEEKC